MNPLKKILLLPLAWSAKADEIPIVGGQALIEGVMMRAKSNIVSAVRTPKKNIVYKKRRFIPLTKRKRWLDIPILRGIINMVEMLNIGYGALNYSADIALSDEEKKDKRTENKALTAVLMVISFIFSVVLAVALFKFLPLLMANFLSQHVPAVKAHYLLFNLIDGLLKILIFILYIVLIALWKDIYRVFQYHGAEHKAVNCFESKLELTAKNAKRFSTIHPRCGTTFVIWVLVISIFFYVFIPQSYSFGMKLLLRILLLPLIVGVSYEFLKLGAKHYSNRAVRILITPGLWFQRLTTREPTLKQQEVAVFALKKALAR